MKPNAGSRLAAGLALAASMAAWAQTGPDLAPLPEPKFNREQAELGRYLFFDVRLSGDAALSCASCHDPQKGWTDGQALGRAYPASEGFRNTPTVLNAAFKKRFMWDGRLDGSDVGTLVRDMITEAHTMNTDSSTHSGKAILLKSPWTFPGWIQFYEAVKPRAAKGEIWVTNGRINETWQSGFDDLRKPYLAQRWPYPMLIVHPADAQRRGIESGDFVQVYNDTVYVQTGQRQGVLDADLNFDNLMKDGHIKTTTGQFVAVAIVSDGMREDVAMANFNYPQAPANSVCHAVPDPVTNNYRYKLGRGVLTKVGGSPYKRSFTSMSLKPRNIA